MAPRDLGIYPEVQTRPDVALDERPDLAKPSLEGLAWLLRHPEEWPRNHQWQFSITLRNLWTGDVCARALQDADCGTAGCALGIAARQWGEAALTWDGKLGCSPSEPGHAIFSKGVNDRSITPSVVAGRIDDYLAGRPIRYLKEGDRSAAHAVAE